MKRLLITTSSALLLLAGGFAAHAATTASGVDAGPVVQNSQAMAAADQAGNPVNMRQQIQDQLTKDGYSGITVMPSSFYVQAKDKAGNPVAMVIGPDSFVEVTGVPAKAGSANTMTPKAGATPDPTPMAVQK